MAPDPGPGTLPRRRRLQRAIAELHYRLRTESDTPPRTALAVALGTWLGCVPVYGAHLALCAGLAHLLGLNRLTTYLAAHVNNPLTAPWLLYGGWAMGRWITGGAWPQLTLAEFSRQSAWSIGRDLLLGSLVLGALMAALLGGAAYFVSRRASHAPPLARRFEETARRYVECGIFHWEFVHGKLWHDPLYAELVRRGLLEGHTVVDLGCGRGIVLALLDAAGAARPGAVVRWVGVERRPALARVARAALGPAAEIVEGDVRDYEPPPADLVLMLDVLHYLDPGWQVRVLERAASALRGGARILVREPDAAGGPRFWLTRAAERAAALCRGGWRQRFHYRRAEDWRALLERQGLVVEAIPLSAGTPFANVLFQARRGAETLDAPEGLA